VDTEYRFAVFKSELKVSQKYHSMKNRVVIVEDDASISALLRLHLEDMGFEAIVFRSGTDSLGALLDSEVDLAILDLNLPGMSGLDVCKTIRDAGKLYPVLMLTARTEEADKVLGFEMGADDYLTKPFGIQEFKARVKALLRRSQRNLGVSEELAELIFEEMVIDRDKRQVKVRGKLRDLTSTEYDLLLFLAQHPGTSFDRKTLLARVWGSNFEGYEHTVNSHINRLRAKIEDDPNKPRFILTAWGVGYRFNDEWS
jgi:two-component system, OmpR family, alkaline phosphatase synthesis response regulator PhoP